ncbi:BgTH12-06394, partial [Blumeria graminis f. sp. triticale]
AALICLCHLVCSRSTRYGFPVLPFSSEVGVQPIWTLIRRDDDQEAVNNTFYRCLYLECRLHYLKSLPWRPQTPLSRKYSKNVRPSMHICDLFTRLSNLPTACHPSRCKAPLEQQSPIDQDSNSAYYGLVFSSREDIAS